MSTLGGLIRYTVNKSLKKSWLPKDKWEAKLKAEGKWKDYSKK